VIVIGAPPPVLAFAIDHRQKVRATQMRTLADILFRMARLRHFVCLSLLQAQVQTHNEKTKDLAFEPMESPRKNLTDAENFSHGMHVVLPTRVRGSTHWCIWERGSRLQRVESRPPSRGHAGCGDEVPLCPR
jgi:hypothetical protein